MCRHVDTVCFIANVVSTHRGRVSFTLPELGRARVQVELALKDQDVVIDWTRNAFLSTMYYYGDFFSKRDDTVTVTDKARGLLTEEFVAQEFNFDLPSGVPEKMRASIREAIPA
jgi:hypothetical protein